MATLYKLEEWQGANGCWYCEHTSSFPKDVDKWVLPSRLLGVSADEFIKWLIKNYSPDEFFHNDDFSFVGWSWKKQADMRKYKNHINKLSREKGFKV